MSGIARSHGSSFSCPRSRREATPGPIRTIGGSSKTTTEKRSAPMRGGRWSASSGGIRLRAASASSPSRWIGRSAARLPISTACCRRASGRGPSSGAATLHRTRRRWRRPSRPASPTSMARKAASTRSFPPTARCRRSDFRSERTDRSTRRPAAKTSTPTSGAINSSVSAILTAPSREPKRRTGSSPSTSTITCIPARRRLVSTRSWPTSLWRGPAGSHRFPPAISPVSPRGSMPPSCTISATGAGASRTGEISRPSGSTRPPSPPWISSAHAACWGRIIIRAAFMWRSTPPRRRRS